MNVRHLDSISEVPTLRFRQPAWLFILLGFAIAPVSIELPSLVVVAAFDGQSFFKLFDRDSAPLLMIGHGISLSFGVPVFLVLEWRNKRRLKHYVLSGLAAGSAIPLLLASVTLGSSAGGFLAGAAVVGSICGMVVSAAFWWIVFGGRNRASDEDVAAVFE